MATRHDRLAASVSTALALRWLARYEQALEIVRYYGGDVSDLPVSPTAVQLTERYTELMRDEVLGERPESSAAELRFLELIEAVVLDQLAPHDAAIVSDEDDLNGALQMVRGLQGQANDRNIGEAIAEERRQRFERTPEEKRAAAERLAEVLFPDRPAKPSEGGEGGAA